MTRSHFSVTADPNLDAVVDTLTRAFWDDPVVSWAFPHDAGQREQLMDGFFRVTTELLLAHGGLVGATSGHEAVLVWSPPGTPDLSEADNARYLSELAGATGRCAARAVTLMETLDAHYPSALPPHVHVMFAAARPEARSWGAGVLLVRALIRQRSEPGLGLYAEASSPDNLSLWQEMGARRIGAEIALPGDGPSLYPIWRESVSVGD